MFQSQTEILLERCVAELGGIFQKRIYGQEIIDIAKFEDICLGTDSEEIYHKSLNGELNTDNKFYEVMEKLFENEGVTAEQIMYSMNLVPDFVRYSENLGFFVLQYQLFARELPQTQLNCDLPHPESCTEIIEVLAERNDPGAFISIEYNHNPSKEESALDVSIAPGEVSLSGGLSNEQVMERSAFLRSLDAQEPNPELLVQGIYEFLK